MGFRPDSKLKGLRFCGVKKQFKNDDLVVIDLLQASYLICFKKLLRNHSFEGLSDALHAFSLKSIISLGSLGFFQEASALTNMLMGDFLSNYFFTEKYLSSSIFPYSLAGVSQ